MMKPVLFGEKFLVRGTSEDFEILEGQAAKLERKTLRVTDPQSGTAYLTICSNDDAEHLAAYIADSIVFTQANRNANETAVTADDVKLPAVRYQREFDPNCIDYNGALHPIAMWALQNKDASGVPTAFIVKK